MPALLLCLFEMGDSGLHAVIHSCDENSRHHHGVFCHLWQAEWKGSSMEEPVLRIVPVDCFEGHTLMIPHDSEQKWWMQVWDQSSWAQQFSTSNAKFDSDDDHSDGSLNDSDLSLSSE